MELSLEGLEREKVRGYVFADGGVWAAAGFDGADSRWGEGFVAGEEFGVFSVGRRRRSELVGSHV